MPDVKIPEEIHKAVTDLQEAARDGAYIAIGLGVLAFQRAQVQRVELTKALEEQLSQLGKLPTAWQGYAKMAREQAEAATSQLTSQLNGQFSNPFAGQFNGQLASQVSDQLGDLSKALDEVLSRWTGFAKAIDERVAPAREAIDEQLDRLTERLPEGARGVVQSVRDAASAQQHAIRSAVGLN